MSEKKEQKPKNDYKLSFKIENNRDSPNINLKIGITEEMKDILLKCTIKDLIESNYFSGNVRQTFKRHKVKNWVINSVNNTDDKLLLFSEELLKNKELIIELEEVKRVDDLIKNLRLSVKDIIQIIKNYDNLEVDVKYIDV